MTCCKQPSIQDFSYWSGWMPGAGERTVNRVCTNCGRHWHGTDGDVREYTRAEWDRLMGAV